MNNEVNQEYDNRSFLQEDGDDVEVHRSIIEGDADHVNDDGTHPWYDTNLFAQESLQPADITNQREIIVEPEEEIIDTSSKPKAASPDKNYSGLRVTNLEDFVDDWDLEDTEEQEHPYYFHHRRNQSNDQLFE